MYPHSGPPPPPPPAAAVSHPNTPTVTPPQPQRHPTPRIPPTPGPPGVSPLLVPGTDPPPSRDAPQNGLSRRCIVTSSLPPTLPTAGVTPWPAPRYRPRHPQAVPRDPPLLPAPGPRSPRPPVPPVPAGLGCPRQLPDNRGPRGRRPSLPPSPPPGLGSAWAPGSHCRRRPGRPSASPIRLMGLAPAPEPRGVGGSTVGPGGEPHANLGHSWSAERLAPTAQARVTSGGGPMRGHRGRARGRS